MLHRLLTHQNSVVIFTRDRKISIGMDPHLNGMSKTGNSFIYNENGLPNFDQFENYDHGIQHDYLELDVLGALSPSGSSNPNNFAPFPSVSPIPNDFAPSPNLSYEAGSLDDQDSDPVLRFLNQMLVEENMEDKPSMFHDPLALRATEKSLYEVIGQKYPHSPNNTVNYQISNSPDVFSWNSVEHPSSSNAGSNYLDSQWIIDPGESNSAVEHGYLQGFSSDSYLQAGSQISPGTASSSGNNVNTRMNFFEDKNLLQNMFSDSESILMFKKGMEEASKFLPPSNQLILNLDKYSLPQKSDDITAPVATKVGNDANDDSRNALKGRKHHHREDEDSEDGERSSKQSAIYVDQAELSKMFEGILLCDDSNNDSESLSGDARSTSGVEKTSNQVSSNGSDGGRALAKKNDSNDDSVDLSTLLIRCAESVTADDRRTAYAQLNQIRQLSSSTGDAFQRLAYVFASGLQARLAGNGSGLYAPLAQRRTTAAEKIKAYQVYLSACPFMKLSFLFADKMIGIMASEATTLHVIDFGIHYGFQWSVLIQILSEMPVPPKLRITGIELPQPGFKPTERLEETGSRLKASCERFGVSFEYQAIAAQNWEKIKLEDLKIVSGEVLAVNCLFRLDQLLDETVIDSPRDAVLDLIRQMKPDIFVNAVTCGSYGVPIFITRFREALFHYSALFDMFDTTLPRDNPQRMDFEQDFYAREVINIIACEGAERVERPQTYKQWQVRYRRAGFKPFPFDEEIMEKLKNKVKDGYHKDFLFDEDGNWMLQGWKGRIICASSCWVVPS